MTIPAPMQAMVLTGHGGLDKYEWHEDWPTPNAAPDAAPDEVLRCFLFLRYLVLRLWHGLS